MYAMDSKHASQPAAPEQPLHNSQTGAEQWNTPEHNQPAGRSKDISSSLGIFSVPDDKAEVPPAIRKAMWHVLQKIPRSDSSSPKSTNLQLPIQLEGTACLAWLPDGQMIGNMPSSFCHTSAKVAII